MTSERGSDTTRRLAGSARTGDTAAMEALFERLAPALMTWSCLRVRDELRRQVDPEDLVQEVWCRAMSKMPQGYDPKEVPFRPWIFKVANYVLLEAFRKLGPRLGTEVVRSDLLEDPDAVPASLTALSRKLARHEALQALVATVRAWAPDDRRLFIFRGLEGLSHEEVAGRLKISGAAARKRWERLRQELDVESVSDELIETA